VARRVGRVLLWLLVLDLGIAFGAGLYEARVVVPQWAAMPPATWPNTGLLFWVYVTTGPLTLLAAGNAIAAWLDRGPGRAWWLSAVAIVVLERIATFAYFIPTMVRLMGAEGLARADVAAGLSQWLFLNHGRHALTLAAWLAALKALSLRGDERWRPPPG
jgi:hypothetical protein